MRSILLCLPLVVLSLLSADAQSEIRTEEEKAAAFQYLQRELIPEIINGKWNAALAKMNIFADDLEGYTPYDDLRAILKAPATGVEKEILPGDIISKAEENTPVLSADGKTLYFCRDASVVEEMEGDSEDIYTASLQEGLWDSVKQIKALSSPYRNDAPLSVSADGTRMFLYINGRIAYSDKTADSWTKPVFLKSPINVHEWQSDAQMTADGRVLLLTIREESTNNYDLYAAVLKGDGSWAVPQNLGPVINTKGVERTPLLHPDMKTLYFSSAGHGGLGGLDVYKSTRTGEGWDQWSKPVNLGKEVNTARNDWGYSISTDGQYAVFASRSRNEDEDLYRIQLPKEMRPEPVTTISGKVEGLKAGTSAKVLLFDEEDNKIGEHRSDPRTGEYFIVLPAGIDPTVKIEGEGLVSTPKKIITGEGSTEVKEAINVVDLNDVGSEAVGFTFEDVLFATDQHQIRPGFHTTLDEIAKIIQEKELNLTIEGHTDNIGDAAYNKTLSQKRAEAVRSYLVAKGCDADRIKAVGFGEEKPSGSNDTAEGRAKNRRVELKFRKG